MSIKQYIKEKKKILRDFCITLTKEQNDHINSLKTEHDVDAYVRDLLKICTIF